MAVASSPVGPVSVSAGPVLTVIFETATCAGN